MTIKNLDLKARFAFNAIAKHGGHQLALAFLSKKKWEEIGSDAKKNAITLAELLATGFEAIDEKEQAQQTSGKAETFTRDENAAQGSETATQEQSGKETAAKTVETSSEATTTTSAGETTEAAR